MEESKHKTIEAIKRSGLSRAEISRRARVHENTIYNAMSGRASNENASALVGVLAEAASLSYVERRELFWELVTAPGQSVENRRTYMKTYADGDPMTLLREAALNRKNRSF